MKIIALILLSLLLCVSCRTARQAQKELAFETRTDTLRIERLRADTLILKDSVSVYVRGDTVRIERWRDRFKTVVKSDTVFAVKTDSVFVLDAKEISPNSFKGYSLPWWKNALIYIGELTIASFCIFIIIRMLKKKFFK